MAYSVLFKRSGSDHMTRGRSRAVDRIVVHYTATLASARNSATYFAHNESQGASAHYFIDDISPEIYQSVAESDTAWHAGNWDMNCRATGIEVVSTGEDYGEAEVSKLAWLVGRLMAKYGIGASGVIRHYDVMSKRCPAPYIDCGKWGTLRGRITGGTVSSGSSGGGAPSGSVADLAQRVIAGEFGNGDARRAALGASYDAVQSRLNEILGVGGSGGSSSRGGADIEALVRAVIRGDYGNGEERKRRLDANYAAVQARVNEILL